MAANWVPDQALFMQTIEVLQGSHSPNTEIQMRVQQALTEYKRNPDFNRYLLCVLIQGVPAEMGWSKGDVEATRSVAGIVLKNNIRAMHEQPIPVEVLAEVKRQCLLLIGDPSELIRATVGLLITALGCRLPGGPPGFTGLESWPELLPALLQCIENPSEHVVLGAFSSLQKVCEDSTHEMLQLEGVLQVVLPKLIQFLQYPLPKVRVHALSCLNQFVHHSNIGSATDELLFQALGIFDAFLQGVFALTSDDNSEVRCNVVQALVQVFEIDPERMSRWLPNLIDYMLQSTADADEQVAQEACEFWLSLAEEEGALAILAPKLNQLIPLLLQHMRYSDHDVFLLRGDEDDADVADLPQDIRPHIVKGKRMGADDDSDDEDDDAADALSEWSLRKSAAASLDVLSGVYGDEFAKNQLHQGIAVQGSGNFLEILLPFLNQMLGSAEWEHRESGILALGAIAEGCIEGLSPHLPQLVPFLIGALSSEKALIRSITCWTLSRYASWVLMLAEPASGPGSELLPALLEQLLKRVLDGNKRVQEAACSALAVLEEEANMNGAALLPYLGPILQTLVAAHGTYQEKNMMILYDAIQTLADAVGPALNEEQYIQLLMPSLMDKWRALEGADPNLFPLLECLTSVALALGHGFYPYCEEVHQRCVYLVHSDMQAEAAHRADPANNPEPEKDFVIVALDLLSSITEGVGVAIESLVKNTDILPLLLHYARDYTPEVRQSTFALIGDYAKTCFVHLKPFILIIGEDGQIGGLLPVLAGNLDATHVPVCNNATWAIGEIAMQLGDEMRQFLPQILPPLIALMNNPNNHQPILENTGITLGRMGLVCPAEIAAVLPEFVILWCKYMRGFKNNEEKYDAFRGICKVIMTNPQCIAESLPFFCTAILSWDENSLVTKFPDLPELFRQILQYFKNSVGPQEWQGYFAQFPVKIQPPLQRLYGL